VNPRSWLKPIHSAAATFRGGESADAGVELPMNRKEIRQSSFLTFRSKGMPAGPSVSMRMWVVMAAVTIFLAGPSSLQAQVAGPPTIIDFNPKTGDPGTVVRIDGLDFIDGEPDDHCIVINEQGRYVSVECVAATSNQLTGILGEPAPAAIGQPHQLMVGLGDGIRQHFDLGRPGTAVSTNPLPWIWSGFASNSTVAQGVFTPTSPPGLLGTSLPGFYSGFPLFGKIGIVIDDDWPGCVEYKFSGRFHSNTQNSGDTTVYMSFEKAGSRFECAEVICDLLITAFAQKAIDITCMVTTNISGNPVLSLGFADGFPVNGGNVSINPVCNDLQICCPTNLIVECTGPLTVPLGECFPTATADCEIVPVICTPPLTNGFPLGTNTVMCSATAGGDTENCSFDVIVVDTLPPVIMTPGVLEMECTNLAGTVVSSYPVTATDLCDTNPALSFLPPAGFAFPYGSTTVTVTAADSSGNATNATFTVNVVDTTPPVMNCPTGIVMECNSPHGTMVEFEVTAFDECCPTNPAPGGCFVPVTCDPPSGSFFAVGVTSVVCTATDSAGNTNACSFDVTIIDTTAPTIICPTNLVLECDSPGGAVANYSVIAIDSCCPPYTNQTGSGPIVFNEWMADNQSFLADPADNDFESWFEIYNPATQAFDLTGHVFVDSPQSPVGSVIPQGTVVPARGHLLVWADGEPGQNNPGSHEIHAEVSLSPQGGYIGIESGQGQLVASVDYASQTPDISHGRSPDGSRTLGLLTVPTPNAMNATIGICLVPVTCSPPEGSLLPLGTNPVTCIATDGAGNSDTCMFSVVVMDTTPPQIDCPSNLVVDCTNVLFNIVDFSVTATDLCDPSPTILCTPPPLSSFPLGTSTVNCLAFDGAGNTNTCSFDIIVTNATPTTILSVQAGCDLEKITVVFSGPLDPGTATNSAAYAISPSGALSNAQFGEDSSTICLDVSGLDGGTSYELTVTGVKDAAGKEVVGAISIPIDYTGDLQDLGVDVTAVYPDPFTAPCCGEEMTYIITYDNHGTVAVCDATIRFLYSPLMTNISYTAVPPVPPPTPCSAGTSVHCVDWTLPEILYPGESGVIYVTMLMDDCPPENPDWMPDVNAKATIKPFAQDDHKDDNIAMHHVTADCSMDGGDKEVTPTGCGMEGFIGGDQSLEYTIQFKNPGTGTVGRVVIDDALDADLDLSTLHLVASSHPYTFRQQGPVITWTFDQIELPPASAGGAAGHGYVKYRVDPLPGLTPGDCITNEATIVLDQDPPIQTRATTNTVTDAPLPAAGFSAHHNFEPSPANHLMDFFYTGETMGATFDWNFGTGAIPETSTNQNPAQVAFPDGSRFVTLKVALGGCISDTALRVITPGTPIIHIRPEQGETEIWWLEDNKILEGTPVIDGGAVWTPSTLPVHHSTGRCSVVVSPQDPDRFFRLVEP